MDRRPASAASFGVRPGFTAYGGMRHLPVPQSRSPVLPSVATTETTTGAVRVERIA